MFYKLLLYPQIYAISFMIQEPESRGPVKKGITKAAVNSSAYVNSIMKSQKIIVIIILSYVFVREW